MYFMKVRASLGVKPSLGKFILKGNNASIIWCNSYLCKNTNFH